MAINWVSEPMTGKTVTVLAGRVPEAMKTLERLAKKARRFGCPDVTVTRGERRHEDRTVTEWNGASRRVREVVQDLHVTGDPVVVGSYRFLAKIELTSAGCMVQTAPGETVDESYRHTDGHCDHCKSNRQRRDVFVVRNLDTGEQLQVGRTCLRDFLGTDDPASIVTRFRFWSEVEEQEREWAGSLPWAASTIALLELSAVAIRLFGWCSKGQANIDESLTPTASYVNIALCETNCPHDAKLKRQMVTGLNDADRNLAQETLAHFRGLERSGSDYIHNLRVALADDTVSNPRHIGLVVSAVASYIREQERELRLTREREQAGDSIHLGQPGERLKGIQVTQIEARVVGGSQFGECVLVKFVDAQGNILTWFTGSGTDRQVGEQMVIDGTVKRHTDYKGVKETQLSRVRVKS